LSQSGQAFWRMKDYINDFTVQCENITEIPARWLLEGFSDIVRQHEVLATVSVWFKDSARPIEYEYEVGETIYKIHNSWKIRPLSQRHRLPAEYVPSIVVPSSKIFYRPVC